LTAQCAQSADKRSSRRLVKIRIGNVESRNDRFELPCERCGLSLGLHDLDSPTNVPCCPVIWVFDFSIPKRLYCSVRDGRYPLTNLVQPTRSRLIPLSGTGQNRYFFTHHTPLLLFRIDFPDFGSASETCSNFWNLRVLKKPRNRRGPFMNDNASWISLAALTANVARFLVKEDQKEQEHKRRSGRHNEQHPNQHPRADGGEVDERLNKKPAP